MGSLVSYNLMWISSCRFHLRWCPGPWEWQRHSSMYAITSEVETSVESNHDFLMRSAFICTLLPMRLRLLETIVTTLPESYSLPKHKGRNWPQQEHIGIALWGWGLWWDAQQGTLYLRRASVRQGIRQCFACMEYSGQFFRTPCTWIPKKAFHVLYLLAPCVCRGPVTRPGFNIESILSNDEICAQHIMDIESACHIQENSVLVLMLSFT